MKNVQLAARGESRINWIQMAMLVGASMVLASWGAPQALEAQSYPDGMVAYWKFDDGGGTTAADSVGVNQGSVEGANWTSGIVGGALAFDGIDDHVEIPDSLDLRFSDAMSVELWVRAEQTIDWDQQIVRKDSSYALIAIWDGSASPASWVFIAGWHKPGSSVTPDRSDPMSLGEWHHLATTYDGSTLSCYLDGALFDASPRSGLIDQNSNPVLIGTGWNRASAANRFDGLIDEVAFYNRALTPNEILQHYEQGLEGLGYELVPAHGCVGFEPPMADYPVAVKGNRALPLKVELLDEDGYAVSGADVAAPPVIQVWYEYGTPEAEDVSDEALPAGQGTEGNQFVYTDEGKWHFNLKTKNYTAPGTYTVFIESGDTSEYRLNPSCTTQLVLK